MFRTFVFLGMLSSLLFAEARCPGYSPGKYNLYWGDLHTHSSFSFDAITLGTRMSPIDEYAFAKGTSPTKLQSGQSFYIPRKLDFLAATDHSEFLGALDLCTMRTSNPLYKSPYCAFIRSALYPLFEKVFGMDTSGGGGMPMPPSEGFGGAVSLDPETVMNAILSVAQTIDGRSYPVFNWDRVRAAADSANSPCSFSAFNGYEYSLSAGGSDISVSNLHRNVIFASDKVPSQAFNFLQYPKIEDLWNQLGKDCKLSEGCDVITIPHNSNWGMGMMFNIETQTSEHNSLRAKYEPLVEITQIKGSSECLNPGKDDSTSPDCNFEVITKFGPVSMGDVTQEQWSTVRSDYVRTALGKGLSYYQTNKMNPLKMGFVGATDNHNGSPGYVGPVANANYYGGHGIQDDIPEKRLLSYSNLNPGGITAVWAEENSRAAIFDAMKKRRTYATSGPRIGVKFFQTFNQTGDPCSNSAYPYSSDVLMGGDMVPPSNISLKPRFVVNSSKDTANLARIDIIKAVVDSSGKATESVVSLNATDPVNGSATLCRTWVDNNYDASKPTFYYARVLEVPTFRWSHYDCQAIRRSCNSTNYDCTSLLDQCNAPNSKLDSMVQQRAYTSPIWSLPK